MRQIFIFFLISLIIISNKKSSALDDLKNPSKLEILFDSEVQKLEISDELLKEEKSQLLQYNLVYSLIFEKTIII